MSLQLQRYKSNPLLTANPEQAWEAGSVFNPGVVRWHDSILMLYRATPTLDFGEPGNYSSSVGLATSPDGLHFSRRPEPLISPSEDYEAGLGCEDARVTILGDTAYIFYNAVRASAAALPHVTIALATTTDFQNVVKHGPIIASQSASIRMKAAAAFPLDTGRIGLAFTMATESPFSSIMYLEYETVADLAQPVDERRCGELFTRYDDYVLLAPSSPAERGPELGAPPIRTEAGWLLMVSPVNQEPRREWRIGAVLLDLVNPRKVLGYLPDLLRPTEDAELHGVVDRVTFPSGSLLVDRQLRVYYGSGDNGICVATCDVDPLLDALLASPLPPQNWPY